MSVRRLQSARVAAKDLLSAFPALLAAGVRREILRDCRGLPAGDPGAASAVEAGLAWLGRAQDRSVSRDGGVARHYGLADGWAASYPETTGYIIPTLLASGDPALRQRARRALDWLVGIQMEGGAYRGGVVSDPNEERVVFNTGQILLGMAAGLAVFQDTAYRHAMESAAGWLLENQHPDGSWPRFSGPYAPPGPKAYHAHVAWGLLEAARVAARRDWGEAALANVRWTIGQQRPNGWFESCCLVDERRPLTHTLGYALRGVIEAWRYGGGAEFLRAATATADGLLGALRPGGFLPGRLTEAWSAASRWSCLTGTAQISECWLLLSEATGEARYRDAAFAANRFVRRTLRLNGDPDLHGAVPGTFPVWGAYNRFVFPNWACKFMVDANRRELEHRARTSSEDRTAES